MATANAVIRFDPEPVARSMFDLVDAAAELYELIPEWHHEERERLQTQMCEIVDVLDLAIEMHRDALRKNRSRRRKAGPEIPF